MPLDYTGTTYAPPGVYVDEQPVAPSAQPGFGAGLPAILGPALGYRTHTEAVVLTGTAATELAQLGIDTTSIVVRGSDGTAYTLTDDYTVTVDEGDDIDVDTDNITSIARVSDSDIDDGERVTVTYHYTDAALTAPRSFRSYDEVRAYYGEYRDATGAIVSPLSLGAKMAFDSGAAEVVCVATPTAGVVTRAELADAEASISGNLAVGLIVPLPVGIDEGDAAGILTDLHAHCDAASDDGLFRVGITGFDSIVTTDPATLASGVNSRRVVLAWPNQMLLYNSVQDRLDVIGGYYLAAAYAGTMADLRPQDPLTAKTIRGFDGIPSAVRNAMTPTTMNLWATSGVAISHIARSGGLVVRHGVTTDNTTTLDREISLVRAKDGLVSLFTQTYENSGVIGSVITESLMASVKGLAQGAAEQAKLAGLITGYGAIGVRRRPGNDQTVLEVSIEYGPPFPLNYIVLVLSVNTNTGAIGEVLPEAA